MKKKNVFLVMILLIAGSLSSEVMAQKTINALVKKCESIDGVDMNIVKNRDRKTKQVEKTIINLTIENNPSLVKEFIAAFEKDEPDAYQIIQDKKNGKIIPQFYRFEGVSYSFSMSDNGKSATVTVIQRSENSRSSSISWPSSFEKEWFYGSLNTFDLSDLTKEISDITANMMTE